MKRACVIVNPVAGARRPRQWGEQARRRLQEAGWRAELRTTERPGHATTLAREHGRGCERVVVVGGDGTLRETVIGLGPDGPPTALVPTGNANVVARELGVPLRPEQAVARVAGGRVRVIDAGQADEAIFLAMVGVGYDGWVTAGVGRMRATRWGRLLYTRGGSWLLYVLAGLPALLRLRPTRVLVQRDGRPLPHAYPSLVIANTATYALGWAMTPGARVDDGRLDYQANRRAAPWFVLAMLGAAVARRRLPGWFAEYGSGCRFRLAAERPFRWQLDGDPMPPRRELTVRVRPRVARMLVPGDGAEAAA